MRIGAKAPIKWGAIIVLLICLIQDKRYSELQIRIPYNFPNAERV